mmetsp:Transcript_61918/g.147483  ORF Transcript_61918/g.147483 Transcript_61918/m.147483 type:complete len:204 (-) Transcript_61918:2295-2906(-)
MHVKSSPKNKLMHIMKIRPRTASMKRSCIIRARRPVTVGRASERACRKLLTVAGDAAVTDKSWVSGDAVGGAASCWDSPARNACSSRCRAMNTCSIDAAVSPTSWMLPWRAVRARSSAGSTGSPSRGMSASTSSSLLTSSSDVISSGPEAGSSRPAADPVCTDVTDVAWVVMTALGTCVLITFTTSPRELPGVSETVRRNPSW